MGSELQSKFKRLAEEYGKVKGHADVLKEALLKQRNENALLQENVRENEQVIRKNSQENEALHFRNQQLSKRVEVLQEEVDTAQRKKEKKAKGANLNISSEHLNVQAEELQARIVENERLQSLMDKLSQDSSRTITILQNQVSNLESYRAREAEEAQKLQNDQLSAIENLEMQKALLQAKLERRGEELQETTSKLENLKLSKAVNEDVTDSQADSGAFSFLDLPQFDSKVQSVLCDVINDLQESVAAFTTHITNYFSYLEQRSKCYPIDSSSGHLSPINEKFTQLLYKFASGCSHPLQNSFNKIIDVCRQGQVVVKDHILLEFEESCLSLVQFIDRIVPFHFLSLKEESDQTVCGESLEMKNSEMVKAVASLPNKFKLFQSYVAVLIRCSQFQLPVSSIEVVYSKLVKSFAAIGDSIKEILTCFSSKVVQEYSLPTISKNLQTTSECVLSSLTALNAASKKVSLILNNNSATFVHVVTMRVSSNESTSCDLLDILREKACHTMRIFNKTTFETVPFQLALHMAKSLHFTSNDTQSLTQQVKELKDSSNKLEQEKEKWILEAQLLKIKYDREHQRAIKFEKQLSGLQKNVSAVQEITLPTEEKVGTPIEVAPEADEESAERAHAELIANHYSARIAELTAQLQDAESKASLYYSEYCVLYKQIQHFTAGEEKVHKELKSATENQARLQDELSITKDNYESQISVMSDHICSLNETITKQRDEMELSKSTKGKKKKL